MYGVKRVRGNDGEDVLLFFGGGGKNGVGPVFSNFSPIGLHFAPHPWLGNSGPLFFKTAEHGYQSFKVTKLTHSSISQ